MLLGDLLRSLTLAFMFGLLCALPVVFGDAVADEVAIGGLDLTLGPRLSIAARDREFAAAQQPLSLASYAARA